VYTLVARGKVFEDITEDARILALMDQFLLPGYLLTVSQAICIYPGEAAQALHTDDSFCVLPRPRPAVSLAMILAIDPFTAENGATCYIPGSHLWSEKQAQEVRWAAARGERSPLLNNQRQIEMPAGACAVFQGTLVHGGGANHSQQPRPALTNQYCEPWVRTQENFYLGVPRDQVRAMSPRLQMLLGYAMIGTVMGQVSGTHPLKALAPGFRPPVVLQRPRG
jgi:ectoine hydroxylase-related dioxygenase (phytanoyl-CoA dioxygenase family)